jgi:hypothetical protein
MGDVTPIRDAVAMTVVEAIPIPTNDLLRHVELRLQVHGNEVAWIRSISGPAEHPILAVGLGPVTMFGYLDVVRERLAALLGVIDRAVAQPGLWPQISPHKMNDRHWTRDNPNPFVALGNGPLGPKFVGPIQEKVRPPSSPRAVVRGHDRPRRTTPGENGTIAPDRRVSPVDDMVNEILGTSSPIRISEAEADGIAVRRNVLRMRVLHRRKVEGVVGFGGQARDVLDLSACRQQPPLTASRTRCGIAG